MAPQASRLSNLPMTSRSIRLPPIVIRTKACARTFFTTPRSRQSEVKPPLLPEDAKGATEEPQKETTKLTPRRTQAEQDAALMAAYREKFGGDVTATFEDGQATEMKRGVRKNMFRCEQLTVVDSFGADSTDI